MYYVVVIYVEFLCTYVRVDAYRLWTYTLLQTLMSTMLLMLYNEYVAYMYAPVSFSSRYRY